MVVIPEFWHEGTELVWQGIRFSPYSLGLALCGPTPGGGVSAPIRTRRSGEARVVVRMVCWPVRTGVEVGVVVSVLSTMTRQE